MKRYIYQKKFYQFKVVYLGYFVVLIALYSVYRLLIGFSKLYVIVLLVCIYQIINTFISLSNPEEVDVDKDSISFKGFGKTHHYRFKDIQDFRVKEFVTAKKIYLRINKDSGSLLKGRYWIDCLYFSDGDELFSYLLKKEDEFHPDTIKAYAHRSNALPTEKNKKQEK